MLVCPQKNCAWALDGPMDALLNQSTLGVIVLSVEGQVIKINKKFQDTFCLETLEQAQNWLGEFHGVHSGGIEPDSVQEHCIQSSEGTKSWFQFWKQTFHNPEGEMIFECLQFLDVTPYKKIEQGSQELKELNNRLEQQIKRYRHSKSDERRHARERLQEFKLEALRHVSQTMAKDFHVVVSDILRHTHGFEHGQQLPQSVLDTVSLIQKSAERGQDLADQLLSYVMKENYHMAPLNLNPLVQRLQNQLSTQCKGNLNFCTDLYSDLWGVKGDAQKLFRLLWNVGVNAFEAMPGGGEVWIETRNLVVDTPEEYRACVLHPGKYVEINVVDSGTGVSPDLEQKIFDPFFTTKGQESNKGLGLFIAHEVVRNHTGLISVCSPNNQGAVFRLCLPADDTLLVQDRLPSDIHPHQKLIVQ